MAYLLPADLKTHLYAENMNQITRSDNTLVQNAIDAAISEAKSYLSRYDLDKLFNPDATGYVADVNLKNKVKDICIWQLIAVANVNIDYNVAEKRYDDAIKWLNNIMKGQADPAGWPVPADDLDTPANESNDISWTSNPKRNNYL